MGKIQNKNSSTLRTKAISSEIVRATMELYSGRGVAGVTWKNISRKTNIEVDELLELEIKVPQLIVLAICEAKHEATMLIEEAWQFDGDSNISHLYSFCMNLFEISMRQELFIKVLTRFSLEKDDEILRRAGPSHWSMARNIEGKFQDLINNGLTTHLCARELSMFARSLMTKNSESPFEPYREFGCNSNNEAADYQAETMVKIAFGA